MFLRIKVLLLFILSLFVLTSCNFSPKVGEESFLSVLIGFDNVILTEDKFLEEFGKAIGSQQEGVAYEESLELFKFHISNFSSAVENLDEFFENGFGRSRPLVLKGYYDFYRPMIDDYLFFARGFSEAIIKYDMDDEFYYENFQKLRVYSYKLFYVSNEILNLMMDSEYQSSVLNLY